MKEIWFDWMFCFVIPTLMYFVFKFEVAFIYLLCCLVYALIRIGDLIK
jgi:hypothetical protein